MINHPNVKPEWTPPCPHCRAIFPRVRCSLWEERTRSRRCRNNAEDRAHPPSPPHRRRRPVRRNAHWRFYDECLFSWNRIHPRHRCSLIHTPPADVASPGSPILRKHSRKSVPDEDALGAMTPGHARRNAVAPPPHDARRTDPPGPLSVAPCVATHCMETRVAGSPQCGDPATRNVTSATRCSHLTR